MFVYVLIKKNYFCNRVSCVLTLSDSGRCCSLQWGDTCNGTGVVWTAAPPNKTRNKLTWYNENFITSLQCVWDILIIAAVGLPWSRGGGERNGLSTPTDAKQFLYCPYCTYIWTLNGCGSDACTVSLDLTALGSLFQRYWDFEIKPGVTVDVLAWGA